MLTDRSPISNQLIKDGKNNFITKIVINDNSKLIGKKSNEGKLEGLENCKILMIQRGEHAEHGPFYSFILEQGYFGNFYKSRNLHQFCRKILVR